MFIKHVLEDAVLFLMLYVIAKRGTSLKVVNSFSGLMLFSYTTCICLLAYLFVCLLIYLFVGLLANLYIYIYYIIYIFIYLFYLLICLLIYFI